MKCSRPKFRNQRNVAPLAGARIEILKVVKHCIRCRSPPSRGRELKYPLDAPAPTAEVAPLAGARIEIVATRRNPPRSWSPPSRGRELK